MQVALNDLVINHEKSINRQHITDAVHEISVVYPALFEVVREAKVEFYAQRNARKIVKKVYKLTLPLETTLNSMQAILRNGFPPPIMIIVKQMAPELNAIYKALSDGAKIVVKFFDKSRKDTVDASDNLAQLVKKLDKKFKSIRLNLMRQHQLHQLYPAMIRFHAYLSVLRDFAFHWHKLVEILHKEYSTLGYALLSPSPAPVQTSQPVMHISV